MAQEERLNVSHNDCHNIVYLYCITTSIPTEHPNWLHEKVKKSLILFSKHITFICNMLVLTSHNQCAKHLLCLPYRKMLRPCYLTFLLKSPYIEKNFSCSISLLLSQSLSHSLSSHLRTIKYSLTTFLAEKFL